MTLVYIDRLQHSANNDNNNDDTSSQRNHNNNYDISTLSFPAEHTGLTIPLFKGAEITDTFCQMRQVGQSNTFDFRRDQRCVMPTNIVDFDIFIILSQILVLRDIVNTLHLENQLILYQQRRVLSHTTFQ